MTSDIYFNYTDLQYCRIIKYRETSTAPLQVKLMTSRFDFYEGEWNQSTFHGSGKLRYLQDGRQFIYTGQFANGYFHGKGAIEMEGETHFRLSGFFNLGRLCGDVEITYWDGLSSKISLENDLYGYELVGEISHFQENGEVMTTKIDTVMGSSLLPTTPTEGIYRDLFSLITYDARWFMGLIERFDIEDDIEQDQPNQEVLKAEGKIYFLDGTKYKGSIYNGIPHGEGTFFYPDGSFFHGKFNSGELDLYPAKSLNPENTNFLDPFTGNRYIKSWESPISPGILIFKNGDVWEGGFHSFTKPAGKGVLTWNEEKKPKYEGTIEDLDPVDGAGTFIYRPHRVIVDAIWVDGAATGTVYDYLERGTFVGEINDLNPAGNGEITWNNGEKFIGNIYHGSTPRDGEGTYFDIENIQKQVGTWKDDIGKVDIFYSNGSVIKNCKTENSIISGEFTIENYDGTMGHFISKINDDMIQEIKGVGAFTHPYFSLRIDFFSEFCKKFTFFDIDSPVIYYSTSKCEAVQLDGVIPSGKGAAICPDGQMWRGVVNNNALSGAGPIFHNEYFQNTAGKFGICYGFNRLGRFVVGIDKTGTEVAFVGCNNVFEYKTRKRFCGLLVSGNLSIIQAELYDEEQDSLIFTSFKNPDAILNKRNISQLVNSILLKTKHYSFNSKNEITFL